MDFLWPRRRCHFPHSPRLGGPASLSRSRLPVDALALRSSCRCHRRQCRLSRLPRSFSVPESRSRHPIVSHRPSRIFFLAQTRRLLSVVGSAAAVLPLLRSRPEKRCPEETRFMRGAESLFGLKLG